MPSGLSDSIPLSGWSIGVVFTTRLSFSISISLGNTVPSTGVSSLVLFVSFIAIGASFTAVMVIETIAVSQRLGVWSSHT